MEEIPEESSVEEGFRSITSCHFAKPFLLFAVGGLAWGRVRFFFFIIFLLKEMGRIANLL